MVGHTDKIADEGDVVGALGFAPQRKSNLLGATVALLGVADHAGGHQVLPRLGAAEPPRHNVVDGDLLVAPPAILALIVVILLPIDIIK